MDAHDFTVEITTMRGHVLQYIPKSECFQDSEGAWYFTVDKPKGDVFARFLAIIPDTDFDKLTRRVTDFQKLCSIGRPTCCPPPTPPCPSLHQVQYEMVTDVDLDDATYLCDSEGNLIVGEDGARIQITP